MPPLPPAEAVPAEPAVDIPPPPPPPPAAWVERTPPAPPCATLWLKPPNPTTRPPVESTKTAPPMPAPPPPPPPKPLPPAPPAAKPEIRVTLLSVRVPLVMKKIRDDEFPLMVALKSVLMVRLLLTRISPPVSVMVPVSLVRSMVSPAAAAAIAERSDPGPASPVFVTVVVVALGCRGIAIVSIAFASRFWKETGLPSGPTTASQPRDTALTTAAVPETDAKPLASTATDRGSSFPSPFRQPL